MGDPRGTVETVTGPIGHAGFTTALAHEHLFVDFLNHIYNAGPEPIPWKEIVRGHQIVLGARDAMEKKRIMKL